MSSVEIPDAVLRDLIDEFGDDAPRFAERALRNEIARHRIVRAVKAGQDPAVAVAQSLSNDSQFLADLTDLAVAGKKPVGDLTERLRFWAV